MDKSRPILGGISSILRRSHLSPSWQQLRQLAPLLNDQMRYFLWTLQSFSEPRPLPDFAGWRNPHSKNGVARAMAHPSSVAENPSSTHAATLNNGLQIFPDLPVRAKRI
jgi:hypothetical protein